MGVAEGKIGGFAVMAEGVNELSAPSAEVSLRGEHRRAAAERSTDAKRRYPRVERPEQRIMELQQENAEDDKARFDKILGRPIADTNLIDQRLKPKVRS